MWLSTAAWPAQLKQMFPSVYTKNGAFVLEGLCWCPEQLKPGLPAISFPSLCIVSFAWEIASKCQEIEGFLVLVRV